jgi:uncharacterized protein YyaL (SSP411 family)
MAPGDRRGWRPVDRSVPDEGYHCAVPPAGASPRHTNRLASETSPYLLQHAHNPVDWYPWGPDALEKARRLDRPIFLSIGYAACHWCHVMERESFEDEATADLLNGRFISIKVDREERPDLDQVYMAAVVALTGQGGWPMSVFLTPDGRPFYGGTYFPDAPRHGMPAFRQVLEAIDDAWRNQRDEIERTGQRLVEAIVAQQRLEGPAAPLDESTLEAAELTLERDFDPVNGGWGGAPKFPQAMTIEFLLRRSAADGTPDARALAMARRTLDRMASGGIFDQLGGGFHRYATDATWLVPHFEKMLYDNALLARVYLHAFQLTGERRYRDVATATLDYLAREMRTPEGLFASSQDADTDGVEGATFTWRAGEIAEVLADAGLSREDVRLFGVAYGVTEGGNWEGRTILARGRTAEDLGTLFEVPPDEVEARLAAARSALLTARARRPQPARDDKALAAWNGLAIAAFAEAARALRVDPEPETRDRAEGYAEVARSAAAALLERSFDGAGRLRRSWKDGRATGNGVLEDYANVADGLLALYEATGDERWYDAAVRLAEHVLDRFGDPAGGFFDTSDDHETLVARPRDLQDNASPSGGSMITLVLLRLMALTGDARYREAAERSLEQVSGLVGRYPTGFGQWLVAADFALARIVEVAVVGDPADRETRRLLAPVDAAFRPHLVTAVSPDPVTSSVPLLQGRFQLQGRPTAFVCRHFACRQPVHEPEALAALLVEGPVER